jgi:predicted PurR-regulated permease PerM
MASDRQFVNRVFLVTGVAVLALLAWLLVEVLLLAFTAVLVALVFRALAEVIEKFSPLTPRWSLGAAVLLVLGITVGGLVLFGAQLSSQVGDLISQLPAAWHAVQLRIGEGTWLHAIVQRIGNAENIGSSLLGRVTGAVSTTFGIIADVVVVLFAALYIAAQPRLYLAGFLTLVPPGAREPLDKALSRCGTALRHWLFGQLIAMVLVGTVIGVGLTLLGVPSALALGLFAGLIEFVPIVGPIAGAVPAIVIALSQDATLAVWVFALFVVVQQIEGNLIQPLIQSRMVDLPPAVTLFAVVGFGLLLGPLGILLATPLAVVCFVLVEDLYVARLVEAGPATREVRPEWTPPDDERDGPIRNPVDVAQGTQAAISTFKD